jgi:hypothetical protein
LEFILPKLGDHHIGGDFLSSLTGKLTSNPDTWKASSTLFEASTLPGNVRTLDSAPADTTIVLTGRTTSAGAEAFGEQPETRRRIERTIGTLRSKAPRHE